MQNTVVYLIRHSTPEHPLNAGQPAMYGPDAPLTADGRLKAQNLRTSLITREGKPFDVIYSSPFKRAFETASILAEQALQKKVIVIEGLRDTVSDWPGTPMDELSKIADAGQLFNDPRNSRNDYGNCRKNERCLSPNRGRSPWPPDWGGKPWRPAAHPI